MRFKRKWQLLLMMVIALALLVFSGCGRAPAQPTPTDPTTPTGPTEPGIDEGGILLASSIGDASFLNPILSADTATGQIVGYIFEGLVEVDGFVELQPKLAESWTTSADELLWTFKLRQGVQWHDGAPFTSKDVKFTYDSILHPSYTGPRVASFNTLIGAGDYLAELNAIGAKGKEGTITAEQETTQKMEAYQNWLALGAIKTPDAHTVVFELARPFAPFLFNAVTLGILPEHILKDAQGVAMRDHEFSRNPIGTGSFKFNRWSAGEFVSVVRNPDHWTSVPHLDELVMKIIPDASTLEIALESGELDLGPIQHESYDLLADLPYLEVVEFPQFSYTYFGMNLTNPLFQDQTVRQALAHAMNKQAMVDEIFQGLALPAHSHGAPARWDYNPDVKTYAYDPAKAKTMLAQAGWVAGADGILVKDGKRFEFTLQTNQGNKARETAAVIIQENLEGVGIKVEVQLVEWSTFVNTVLLARQFETCIVGWALGTDPDAFTIWHTDGGAFNFVGYSNTQVDALIEEGRRVGDVQVRKGLYQQMQAILAEELPYVFLFFPSGLQGVNMRVSVDGPLMGSPVHSGPMTWNAYDWWIAKEYQSGPILAP